METIIIEAKNKKALKLLENLEALKIIRIIRKTVSKTEINKISERLTGCITKKEGNTMIEQLNKNRNEWERDI